MTRNSRQGRIAATMADNAFRTLELGVAAQSVVAARMALGVEAAQRPQMSHLHEATRMTEEKFSAFGESMAAASPKAVDLGRRMAAAGVAEASAAMVAGAAVARADHPAVAAGIGARYASDAMMRAFGTWTSMASAMVGVQSRPLPPSTAPPRATLGGSNLRSAGGAQRVAVLAGALDAGGPGAGSGACSWSRGTITWLSVSSVKAPAAA